MFRAISCSSSGSQIKLITTSGIVTVSKWQSGAPDSNLLTVKMSDAVINKIWPPEDEQDIDRNILIYFNILINVL
jgi:hypothetical protein